MLKLTILHDDITQQDVDAIVNPSNSYGFMGGGVALAIKTLGGDEIENQAASHAPIPIGTAVITTAGRLRCRKIIHAPTMEQPGGKASEHIIGEAITAALHCAEENRLERIAIPGMGTGIGGFPKSEAARLMVDAIINFDAKSLKEVLLVDKDIEMVKAWKKLAGK
ncbi:macro domain-containing protein [Candidatus Woesearchaeota archaeon]|nr:macro domain-containing protein [Candidatus Woesearchaeota archaeon]